MSINDKHSVIYDLGAKKLSGEISIDEQLQLDKLILESEDNKIIYDDLVKVWNNSQSKIKVDVDLAWDKLSTRIDNDITPVIELKLTRNFQWMSIAASILLVLGIFSIYKFNQVEIINYTASVTEQIQLPDGSKVDLKANSSLEYPEKFTENNREVKLIGQAFFDVERDESKPFIIHTNTVDVQVLGTSFYVNSYGNGDVEVKVKTGKVKVTDVLNDTNNVVLIKDENILFTHMKHTFNVAKIEVNKLYWQTKTLVFKRTTLQNAVDLINTNYNKNVVIANEEMKNCKLTVTFKNKSFEEVMEVIKATFNAKTEFIENEILLKGEGCE